MSDELMGKVAVITGSTRGLGLAIARAYADAGAAVVVGSRSLDSVQQAVDDLRQGGAEASGQPVDVGDRESVEALASHASQTYGGFDIWVNNAGLSAPYGPTADLPVGEFERIVQTNILGTYYGSVTALRHFVSRGAGKLINLSGRGDRKPVPLQNAYAPSKAWVRSFTLALAEEYKDTGVGVYLFNPGLVKTEMLSSVAAIEGYEERLNPLKTVVRMWGNDAEVPARKAVWLASDATDGQTGLYVRFLTFPRVVRGLVGEGLRRLLGRPKEEMALDVTSVPPASSNVAGKSPSGA